MSRLRSYADYTAPAWLKVVDKALIPLLAALSVFLTLNLHSKHTFNNYHDVLWADAAGYYVYLPGVFIYGDMQAAPIPEEVFQNTGGGFKADTATGLIFTKYTYGVSLMQAPFFGVAHLVTKSSVEPANGFSKYYQKAIQFAAVFYTIMALLLLKAWLRRYFARAVVVATVFFVYLGTNLLYYTVDKSGMSHAYSFFLMAAVLLLVDNYRASPKWKTAFLLGLSFSLLVLIRPTAIVILPFVVFYNGSVKMKRIQHVAWWWNNSWQVLAMVVVGVLLAIPQLFYWYNLHGEWLHYTYEGEGFTEAAHPHVLELFFSPNNGLFTWSPMVFIMLIGLLVMIRDRQSNGWRILFVFAISAYLFASWWNWTFGCGFGARSFVEYYVLLAIPFAWLLQKALFNKRQLYRYALLPVLVVLVAVNIKMMYGYDDCYYASTWDFEPFFKLLTTW